MIIADPGALSPMQLEVPSLSAELYRAITEFAHGTPPWLHTVAEIGTDAGLVLFAAMFLAAWWRARAGEARGMALALLAPCVTVVCYLFSETVKGLVEEARPCRAMLDVATIAQCPAVGDWSFPSNHATVVAAAAAAVVVAWRRLAFIALPLAALMAFSRVFVGVHYPHDVAVGVFQGVLIASLLALLLAKPAAPLVRWLRDQPVLRPLLSASKGRHHGPAAETRPEHADPLPSGSRQ